ncbi:hypothetical protein VitviT2T_017516 [Vitis vinifera]|uniref:Uncharacterized protein n=1 Tax=Vitis vinifera TaxID=29760 RepID=A0ABY9CWL7_VITVI|nr:hypothetical protein VitviT2T_017516 [Vitis vinifera]
MLEILCGRKNLDRFQPEEDMHLLNLFQRKVKEDQMLDLVDKSSEDMQLHGTEVVEMMKLAAWCLQNDIAKRPSMSVVVKVLDGVMDVEGNLDYCFFSPQVSRAMKAVHNSKDDVVIASTVLPSILSGPSAPEQGIAATLAVIGTQKLAYPDDVYDLAHCARCRVHWDADGG